MLDSRGGMGFFANLHLTVCEYVLFCWRKMARTSLSPAIARFVRRGEIAHPGKARFVLLKKA